MKKILLITALLGACAGYVRADSLTWTGVATTPDSGIGLLRDLLMPNVSISQINNYGTTTLITSSSASSGYAGASAGNNYGMAVRTNAFDLSLTAGFVFTLNNVSPDQLSIDSLSFGSRSTGTGPQLYTIRVSSSPDSASFTSDVAGGALQNNSTWALVSSGAFSGVTVDPGATLYIALFGYGGVGAASAGTANWRIDDITLNYSVSPVPEPSTCVLLGVGALGLTLLRRRQKA